MDLTLEVVRYTQESIVSVSCGWARARLKFPRAHLLWGPKLYKELGLG